jgi:hypothetical protein
VLTQHRRAAMMHDVKYINLCFCYRSLSFIKHDINFLQSGVSLNVHTIYTEKSRFTA